MGLQQERTMSQNLSKMSYCLYCVKHIKFYRSKIFTFLSPFLRDQKFSLLHYLRYWRYPFEQERTNLMLRLG